MEKKFNLETYLSNATSDISKIPRNMKGFAHVCDLIKKQFNQQWEGAEDIVKTLSIEREKKAIIGFEEETTFYKNKIREVLSAENLLAAWHPDWYPDIVEGIFAELYGLAGLAPWAYGMTEEYRNSSSAKLIGDNMYCMIDGVTVLQPQKINRKRRMQLKRALLLSSPKERLEYGFHEVYLHNGIRITIYSGERTKQGQDVMVFRKYLIKNFNFEMLAHLKTIPEGACKIFPLMVKLGYNVIFAGPVRSGKTTFLQTWQSYEDKRLEGLAIATDPETPWHEILPNIPIMQLVADNKELENITKSLLRGDNDYVLLEEMRDATAYNLALDITSTGTKRSKATIHDKDALNIPYKMATKIVERYGGDEREVIAQVYKNFDFIFEFSQDYSDKSKKILMGIAQLFYDYKKDKVYIGKICEYDLKKKNWKWSEKVHESKKPIDNALIEIWEEFLRELKEQAERRMLDYEEISPAYYQDKGAYHD